MGVSRPWRRSHGSGDSFFARGAQLSVGADSYSQALKFELGRRYGLVFGRGVERYGFLDRLEELGKGLARGEAARPFADLSPEHPFFLMDLYMQGALVHRIVHLSGPLAGS